MKKSKSKRNRHTGKINAAKRQIIEAGEFVRFSDNTEYARVLRRELTLQGWKHTSSYVRLFPSAQVLLC